MGWLFGDAECDNNGLWPYFSLGNPMTAYPELGLLIDGEWRRPATRIPVLNPADQSVLGMLPCAGPVDIADAITAAERGFAEWRRTAPGERAKIILRAAQLIRERAEEIA
jgi:succinate-semialdehyde dehydrogenase/glutarate-semialdehyde dehydrogenase